MSVLESTIERTAIVYALRLGYITFKVSPAKSDGYPDRVFINRHGVHVYIEIKAPGKRPRRLQVHRINSLRKHNVPAFWSNNLGEIERLLNEHVDTKAVPSGRYPTLDITRECGGST